MVAWITVMVAFAIFGIQPTKNIKAGKILSYKKYVGSFTCTDIHNFSIKIQSRVNL